MSIGRFLSLLVVVAVFGVFPPVSVASQVFPAWVFDLRLWPFDILYPDADPTEIAARLGDAVAAGADCTIVYLEEEHMYGTFVDDGGFAGMLDLLADLVDQAHAHGLRVMVYLNGLEVMTHDAVDPRNCSPTSGASMAREHPDWLQLDLEGEPIVYSCLDMEWLTPDMEDAWVSPFSGYRELFKERLASLGGIGVDAVYIDASFLPGLQPEEEHLRWGTTDSRAAADFRAASGFTIPTSDDWGDPGWRAWLLWRHEAVAAYLGDLADAAWTAGMVPFWESSTNDTSNGTLLGNETAATAHNRMGFSPEIEPEGDWLAAFRMVQAARDFAPEHPLIYLGWPTTVADAEHELATALSFSSTLYPTADGSYPGEVFAFADSIRQSVLARRQPHWGHVALVYSVRNKDWTWEEETHFESYDDAFRDLTRAHVPFRILVLEDLDAADLAPFDTVVLPAVASISDAEHGLLRDKDVILLGEVGTRDERWIERPSPLVWPHVATYDLDGISTGLPFELDVPETTFIAFYGDGGRGHFLFAAHSVKSGQMVVRSEAFLGVTVYRSGHPPEELEGGVLTVPITEALTVLHVRTEDTTPPPPRRPSGRAGGEP